MKFETGFDKFICDGENITTTVDGIKFRATINYDSDSSIDNDEGFSIDQLVTGCNDEQQKQLLRDRELYEQGVWWYGTLSFTAHKNLVPIAINTSLCGIEVNYPSTGNIQLLQYANELLPQAVAEAKAEIMVIIHRLSE